MKNVYLEIKGLNEIYNFYMQLQFDYKKVGLVFYDSKYVLCIYLIFILYLFFVLQIDYKKIFFFFGVVDFEI